MEEPRRPGPGRPPRPRADGPGPGAAGAAAGPARLGERDSPSRRAPDEEPEPGSSWAIKRAGRGKGRRAV